MSDVRDPETDQPLPVVNDRPYIQDLVIADIEERKSHGIRKYGTALQSGNGRNMLQDAYEEALDLAIYLRGALDEQGRDDARRTAFAEVSRAMNLVADVWERDGSDPCRVRITREYANAYRLYAEGLGEPTGTRQAAMGAPSAGLVTVVETPVRTSPPVDQVPPAEVNG